MANHPIYEVVCQRWARLVAEVRSNRKMIPVIDSWIAATALAQGVPVVTAGADFDGLPGLDVLRV